VSFNAINALMRIDEALRAIMTCVRRVLIDAGKTMTLSNDARLHRARLRLHRSFSRWHSKRIVQRRSSRGERRNHIAIVSAHAA
jgi:hypothetical protein